MKWWGTIARATERAGSTYETSVSLYGKLPIAADFLRRRCAAGAAASFREWLGQAASKNDGITAAWRTLHVAEGYPDLIVSQIEPSTDATGHRRFPIALYSTVPRDALGRSAPERFARALPAWNVISDAARRVRSATVTQLDAILDSRAVRVEMDTPDPAGVVPIRAVAMVDGGMSPAFVKHMWRLRAVLRDLSARRYRGPDIPCLCLPLPSDGPRDPCGFAWLNVLANLGVGGQGDAPLSLAMPASGTAADPYPPELRVLPRPPLAKDSTEWLSGSPVQPHMVSRPSLDGFAAFEMRIGRLLDADAPLTRVLEVLRWT